jgi:hypothetical protein
MLSKPTAYEKWLGIKSQDQPPTLYRLLGVEPLETDPDIITHAADSRMTYLRQFQTGPNAQLAEEILGEVSHASVVLLNPDQKSAYDQRLRQQFPVLRPVGSGAPVASPLPVARPLGAGLPVVPPRIAVPPAGMGVPIALPPSPTAANSPSLDIDSLFSQSPSTPSIKPSRRKKASVLPWIVMAVGAAVVALVIARIAAISNDEDSTPANPPITKAANLDGRTTPAQPTVSVRAADDSNSSKSPVRLVNGMLAVTVLLHPELE